jgi:hypothetical protein
MGSGILLLIDEFHEGDLYWHCPVTRYIFKSSISSSTFTNYGICIKYLTPIFSLFLFDLPPIGAYRLHRCLPESKLIIVEKAGHSETEPGITEAILKAVSEFE